MGGHVRHKSGVALSALPGKPPGGAVSAFSGLCVQTSESVAETGIGTKSAPPGMDCFAILVVAYIVSRIYLSTEYNDRSFRRARSEPLAKPMLTKASAAEIHSCHFQVHPIKVRFFNMSPKLQVEYCMKEYGSPHLAAISMHILCTSE